MTDHENSRLLLTLAGKKTDTKPIWIMRQAGRYLPEFLQLRRDTGTFMDLCRNPEKCCEATLMPLARFDLDAAIIFSDIMVIPDAMAGKVRFIEGRGPICTQPYKSGDVPNTFDSDLIQYVYDAIAITRKSLPANIPLFGFAGSPWTLFTYVIGADVNMDRRNVAKLMALSNPTWAKSILQALTDAIIIHLQRQIDAGADIVQIFDSWAGVLSPQQYREFSLPYLAQIATALKPASSPVVIYAKGVNVMLPEIAKLAPDAIGIDWTVDLDYARHQIPDNIAIQGNVDPIVLNGKPELAYSSTVSNLHSYGTGKGHIVNLGHGITPQANIESVTAMIEAVRNFQI